MAGEGQDPAAAGEQGQEPKPPEGQEPVTPQEPESGQESDRTYDEATVKKLRREAAEARTRANKAETELKQRDDEQKSEQQRLEERAAQAEKAAEESSARLIRFEVASEHGLDLKAAEFLTGTTREEIEGRAEELVKLIADRPKEPGRPSSFDGGARVTPKEAKSPEDEHNLLILRAAGREPQ